MADSKVFGRNESAALNAHTFEEFAGTTYDKPMTIRGAVNKTTILLGLVVVSAAWSWIMIARDPGSGSVWAWPPITALAAFAVGLITCLNRRAAPVTAPIYAVLEGILVGAISAAVEATYPGVVLPAVMLTFATLFSLLALYRASGFQVTPGFRMGVVSATMAIALVYLAALAATLFGIDALPLIHQTGLIGIGLSLFVVVIAALNLVMDFDLIESGARAGAPRYMEWYAAFGLIVTLIWLYWEVLKLLIQIAASSDDH